MSALNFSKKYSPKFIRLIAQVLLCHLLTGTALASSWKECLSRTIGGLTTRSGWAALSTTEQELIESLLRDPLIQQRYAILSYEERQVMVARLGPDLLKRLFFKESGEMRSWKERQKIIGQWGLKSSLLATLLEVDSAADQSQKDLKLYWDSLEKALHDVQLAFQIKITEKKIRIQQLAVKAHELQVKYHQIRIEQGSIVMPMGQRYRILEKRARGQLVVAIPKDQVIRTQSFLSEKVLVEKIMQLNPSTDVIDQSLTPDGYIFLLDQHHRTTAFQMSSATEIRVLIKPDAQGRYWSLPDAHILGEFGLLKPELEAHEEQGMVADTLYLHLREAYQTWQKP